MSRRNPTPRTPTPSSRTAAALPDLDRRRLLAAAGVLLAGGAAGALRPARAAAGIPAGTAKIASLPAIDALLLFAAEADGLFKAEGLDVAIVPFKSALEMTAALRAGRIAGQYTNIMTTITQRVNGIDVSIVATTWHTAPEARAFGFAVSPKYAAELPTLDVVKQRRGVPTSTSSGTITDWMLDQMIDHEAVPAGALKEVEVPQIPIRLQLLNSGKLETALFYEPLLTLIEQKGGRVVWDDRKLDEPLSMTALRREYLSPAFVGPFRKALAEAARRIDADPKKYLPLAVKKRLIPEAVAGNYQLPKFGGRPTADGLPALPTEAEVARAAQWLIRRGILKSEPDLSGVVCR